MVLAVAALLLASGCGLAGGDEEPLSDADTTPPSATGSPFTPEPGAPDVAGSDACAAVRAGIDAFNLGRYDETVEHFEDAVRLAERRADGSPASNELVEAVRYYADLAPEDYPEAARSSADFAKYKAITLLQCSGGLPAEPDDSASPGAPGFDT